MIPWCVDLLFMKYFKFEIWTLVRLCTDATLFWVNSRIRAVNNNYYNGNIWELKYFSISQLLLRAVFSLDLNIQCSIIRSFYETIWRLPTNTAIITMRKSLYLVVLKLYFCHFLFSLSLAALRLWSRWSWGYFLKRKLEFVVTVSHEENITLRIDIVRANFLFILWSNVFRLSPCHAEHYIMPARQETTTIIIITIIFRR